MEYVGRHLLKIEMNGLLEKIVFYTRKLYG